MSVGIYLCIYLCRAMDPGNPEVRTHNAQHLHFLDREIIRASLRYASVPYVTRDGAPLQNGIRFNS